jgi:AcrR family transcriptional regulator
MSALGKRLLVLQVSANHRYRTDTLYPMERRTTGGVARLSYNLFMQANREPVVSGRTFTEQARRAQIAAAAIETIAEIGYPQASFARIAKRAGLSSTGLISYHFTGKEDLMQQVVSVIVGGIGRFMHERMQGQNTATGALRTYIAGNVEYIASHRTEMKALLEVFMHGGFHYDATAEAPTLSHIENILRDGQEGGEFRAFNTVVMAAVIQRAIDGVPFHLEVHPELDLTVYATELVTVFHLATRRDA